MIKYLRDLTTVRKVYQDVFHLSSQDAQKYHRRDGTRLQCPHGIVIGLGPGEGCGFDG